MSKKIIYLAGAITGLCPNAVHDKFLNAQTSLEIQGYDVINPYAMMQKHPKINELSWEQIMRQCIQMLMGCDAICMLHDWHDSRGAMLERKIAIRVGLPVEYSY